MKKLRALVELLAVSTVARVSSVDLHLWRRFRSCRSGHKHSQGQGGLSFPHAREAVSAPGTVQPSPSDVLEDAAGSTQTAVGLTAACWQASAAC